MFSSKIYGENIWLLKAIYSRHIINTLIYMAKNDIAFNVF